MQRNNDDLTEGGQPLVHRGLFGNELYMDSSVRVTFKKKVTHRICSTLLHKVLLHYFIMWPVMILNYPVMIKTLSQRPTH